MRVEPSIGLRWRLLQNAVGTHFVDGGRQELSEQGAALGPQPRGQLGPGDHGPAPRVVRWAQGRRGEAVGLWERTLAVAPGHARAMSYLGIAARASGDDRRAEALWRRAAELDPRAAGPWLSLGASSGTVVGPANELAISAHINGLPEGTHIDETLGTAV